MTVPIYVWSWIYIYNTYIYIYIVKYYSAIKKNEMLSFVATWMNSEIIIPSEVRQKKTNSI